MFARLKLLDVEDFKSFKGRQIIYPVLPFTTIIGSDFIGKANFIEAIGFVMGQDIGNMGFANMYKLIHGADINNPVSKSASVCAEFILPDGDEFAFRRSVVSTGMEYKINGLRVTEAEYLFELQEKINLKTKSFLIFQSAFESLSMRYPSDITSILEEACGSATYTSEYLRLKRDMKQAQRNLELALTPLEAQCRLTTKKNKATQTDIELPRVLRLHESVERKLVRRKRLRLEAEVPVHMMDATTQTDPIEIDELVEATNKLKLNDDDEMTAREIKFLTRHRELMKSAFERVKKMRLKLFTECLDKVQSVIDDIYKALNRDHTINAVLVPENHEEPYLSGIRYCWNIPGGHFELMSTLPGPEKAIAALALFFAINEAQQAPILVLDRLDNVINNYNAEMIANHVKCRSNHLQIINFTLNEEYFNKGDLIIGIFSSDHTMSENCVSQITMCNMETFFGPSSSKE